MNLISIALLVLTMGLLATAVVAETVTKNVNYNGTAMQMTLNDFNVEIKNGDAPFLRGIWDQEQDYFTGDILGACPFPVRGTVDYSGIFVVFGLQPACGTDAAQWRTLRFIPPPSKAQMEPRPKPKAEKRARKEKPQREKPRRQYRPRPAPTYQQPFWQWQWQR
jgi:hypothetical protein